MPKLWNETVDAHRHAVHQAVLDATAALVAEKGLRSVTMAQIATRAGIGRATLYKYFADVESILTTWHARQIEDHLGQLLKLKNHPGSAAERLAAALEAYALGRHRRHAPDVGAVLHRGDHVGHAEQRLHDFLEELIREGTAAGELRSDVPPKELASYCIHALAAATDVSSTAAVRRLVELTLAGMRP